jgi:hypothetical protein
MAKFKSRNKRYLGTKDYLKVFLIVSEGDQTEYKYFGDLNKRLSNVVIRPEKSNKGHDPLQVLESAIEKKDRHDEVWIVIDHDGRPEEIIDEVLRKGKIENINVSLSKPKFEYWLLLHFENGNGANLNNCTNKLKRYLPDYEKNHLEMDKVYLKIHEAISRAKTKDNPPCDWPKTNGSTVYRLVEKLMESENN